MPSKETNGKKRTAKYYHCSSRSKTPNTPCSGRVSADQLEYSPIDWVVEEFDLKRLRKDVEERVREALSAQAPKTYPSEIKNLKEGIRSIDVKISALLDNVDVLSKDEINNKLSEFKAKKANLQEALAKLSSVSPEATDLEAQIREVMGLFDHLKEALVAFDKLEVQRLLRYFIRDVKVDFERKEIDVEYVPEGLPETKKGAPREKGPLGRLSSGGGI